MPYVASTTRVELAVINIDWSGMSSTAASGRMLVVDQDFCHLPAAHRTLTPTTGLQFKKKALDKSIK